MLLKDFFTLLEHWSKNQNLSQPLTDSNPLSQYQSIALAMADQLKKPDLKSKTWRKILGKKIPTDLCLAPQPKMVVAKEPDRCSLVSRDFSGFLVISEKKIETWLDPHLSEQGVMLCDFNSVVNQKSDLLKRILESQSQNDKDRIAVASSGISRHSFFLYVPSKIIIEKPILVDVNLSNNGIFLPILGVAWIEENSSVPLFMRETHLESGDKTDVLSTNLLIHLADRAVLSFLEIQDLNLKSWGFINEEVKLHNQSKVERLILDLGGAGIKRNFALDLLGAESRAEITGIYTPHTDQVYVYDTHQNHLASHTTSDLLFSGVVDQDASSLWKGNVFVAKDTKATDGYQVNRNLLLKNTAQVEAIPGLEILADDVRCSHAVTMGMLDADQLFYLQSRGISKERAEEMIINGFLQSAVARFNDEDFSQIAKQRLNLVDF